MKRFLGFLLFLVFAEDTACAYSTRLGSPFGWVKTILLDPLPIKVRPLDLILLGILIAAKKDVRGALSQPMKNALFAILGVTLVSFLWGIFHGGEFRFAAWQTYLILSSVLVAFTLAAHFRTAADYVGLAKWILAVAVYRAIMCWISYFTWGRVTLGESGAYLTNHDDTIAWVVAIMALLVNAFDRGKASITFRNLLLIGFFLGAIQFNSRRLAWVSLLMGLAVMYAVFPPGRTKRRITRFLMILAPIVGLYVIVGWGRASPIFLPLRSLSTVSTQEDGSTLARNAENLGLIATANSWGFGLGSGWGKPYICLTTKYDISGSFELWQYVPHNSILALLAFTGIIGSAVFWNAVATAVFLNARVARLGTDPVMRTVAIIGASQVVVCGNQLFGDMGIFFFKPMYFLAISYAIALRLPRLAGVWNAPEPALAGAPLASGASGAR